MMGILVAKELKLNVVDFFYLCQSISSINRLYFIVTFLDNFPACSHHAVAQRLATSLFRYGQQFTKSRQTI